jgi:hypothetical protein
MFPSRIRRVPGLGTVLSKCRSLPSICSTFLLLMFRYAIAMLKANRAI